MNKDFYPFQNLEDDMIYLFLSEGILGRIEKGVLIRPIPDEASFGFDFAFNLGFGDISTLGNNWFLDDSVRSGNGDMPKVIATVAQIAMDFLHKHPESVLSFQGYIDLKSSIKGKNHRNILYQRAINSNWAELSLNFNFWGVTSGRVEKYSTGNQYDQIFVRLK